MSVVDDEMMRQIWGSFAPQQHVFLATSEGDQPKVRPVTLIHFQKRLYVATGSGDAKVRQLKGNPKAEFCLLLERGDQKGTLRAECITRLVEDKEIRADVFNEIPFIREFFKTPEDPGYALVWLKPVLFEYMKPGEIQSVKIKP